MSTNLKRKYIQAQPKQKKSPNLSVVGSLKPARQLKIYSSSPSQRISAKLNYLIKFCFNFALIGFSISALAYFCSVSLEADVAHHLRNLENQIKNREDLKSYLSKVYSWQNLNTKAQEMKFVKAKKVETAPKLAVKHSIFDTV
jgi:hypothetical protein